MSNAALKNIAYITMFTDHFFAIIFTEIINRYQAAGYGTDVLWEIYSLGRAVGRIAFVLFAYLAVEGFIHTRSRRNYLLRLGAFALISEAPFDLAFSGEIVEYADQNVYFTLFLGVLVMAVWEWAQESIHILRRQQQGRLQRYSGIAMFRTIQFFGLLSGCAAAYYLGTDYKHMGVLLIFAFYFTRGWGLYPRMALAGSVMFLGTWSMNYLRYMDNYSVAYLAEFSMRELYGLLAFIPISRYDGRKGRQMPKAVCYGFYPVHLLLLYWASCVVVR